MELVRRAGASIVLLEMADRKYRNARQIRIGEKVMEDIASHLRVLRDTAAKLEGVAKELEKAVH